MLAKTSRQSTQRQGVTLYVPDVVGRQQAGRPLIWSPMCDGCSNTCAPRPTSQVTPPRQRSCTRGAASRTQVAKRLSCCHSDGPVVSHSDFYQSLLFSVGRRKKTINLDYSPRSMRRKRCFTPSTSSCRCSSLGVAATLPRPRSQLCLQTFPKPWRGMASPRASQS